MLTRQRSALLLPLTGFLLVFFVAPLVWLLSLAVREAEVPRALPRTLTVLHHWQSGQAVPSTVFTNMAQDLREAREQFLAPAVVVGELVLDIVARYLMLERNGAPRDDAHLGHGAKARKRDDPAHVHADAGQGGEQGGPGLVVADDAGRQHRGAERREVGEGVGAAARDVALALEAQDDHRGLARNALGSAEHEAVEHEVAVENDAAARKSLDGFVEAGSCAHSRDSSLAGLLSPPPAQLKALACRVSAANRHAGAVRPLAAGSVASRLLGAGSIPPAAGLLAMTPIPPQGTENCY